MFGVGFRPDITTKAQVIFFTFKNKGVCTLRAESTFLAPEAVIIF